MGSTFISGNLDLADRAHVWGNLTVEGDARVGNGTIISGANVGRLRTSMPGVKVTVPEVADSYTLSIVEPGAMVHLSPGRYPNGIAIHSGGRVRLTCGSTYRLRELQLEPNATVEVDTSCGPVRVWLDTTSFMRGTVVDLDQTVKGDILWVMTSSGYFSVATSPQGTVVAPNGGVVVEGGILVDGAVIGRSVEIHQGATVHFVPFPEAWSETFRN